MKKTILLASLVATVASFAGTTGNVKFINENEHDITKKDFVVKKGAVSTEVKVDNSGLSFGGEFKAQDLKPFKDETTSLVALKNLKEHSSVFAKYELPTFKNINTYVKGTLKGEGKATIEGNTEYKLNEISLGANTSTTFTLGKNFAKENISSTHKIYAKGKVNNFKDIDAEIAVSHKYGEKALQYVSGKLHGKYDFTDKLEGKLEFDTTVAKYGTPDVKNLLKGGDIKLTNYGHSEALVLGVKSTHVAKTELTADGILQFVHGVEAIVEDASIERQLEIAKKEVESYTQKLENSKDTKELGKAPLTPDDWNTYRGKVSKINNKTFKDYEDIYNKYFELTIKNFEKDLLERTEKHKEIAKNFDKNQNSIELQNAMKSSIRHINGLKKQLSFIKEKKHPLLPIEIFKLMQAEVKNKQTEELNKLNSEYIKLSKKNLETGLAKAKQKVTELTKKLESVKPVITKTNTLYFGTKLGVKNTSIENLTLTGDATFGGVREVKVVNDKALEPTLTGYVKLHAGALYDYKVSDKLTISPELNTTLTFDNINKKGADTKLVLEPKVSVKYDLTTDKKGLSINGNVAVPVKFENKEKKDFKYSNTTIKSAINVEYVW